MNPDLIAQYFNAECAAALAPLVTLAGGLLLLIVAEWFEPINRLRPLLFVGSILGAAWAEVALLNAPVDRTPQACKSPQLTRIQAALYSVAAFSALILIFTLEGHTFFSGTLAVLSTQNAWA